MAARRLCLLFVGLLSLVPWSSFSQSVTGDVSLLTFNTGLNSERSTTPLLNSITNDPIWRTTDIVCLQELVFMPDFNAVSNALRTLGFTHQHNFLSYFGSRAQPACADPVALNQFGACVASMTHCFTSPVIAANFRFLVTCAFFPCKEFYGRLSQNCLQCIIDPRASTTGNLTATFARCAQEPESNYIPTYGLLLASKRPMTNLEARPFYPNQTTLLEYGYLKGDIDDVGSVFCSHLRTDFVVPQAVQDAIPGYSPSLVAEAGFTSTNESNRNQTEQLITRMREVGRSVLLADTNNGPNNASAGIRSSFPENYPLWEAAGIRSAMTLLGQTECTFCGRTNPLIQQVLFTATDELIDHVLLSSQYQNSVIEGNRAFLSNITGQAVPLSDHYGVRVVINTGSESQVQLSRWERQFSRWQTAFNQWQNSQCPSV